MPKPRPAPKYADGDSLKAYLGRINTEAKKAQSKSPRSGHPKRTITLPTFKCLGHIREDEDNGQ